MFGKSLIGCNGGGGGETPPIDLTQDLVSHYLLNNNVDDSYGTYDGDLFNGVDLQGDMAYCDGIDDYMTMPINTALAPFNQTNFEVGLSFWFYTDAITNNRGICQWGDVLNDGTPFVLLKYDASGVLKFYTESTYTTIQTSLTLNTMYHIFMTRSDADDTWRIYLNGVLKATYTNANVSYSYGQKIFLGNGFGGYTNHSFSNARVYNVYKDQTFVDALYAEGYYPKPLPLPTTDQLMSYHPFTGTAEDMWASYNGIENGGLTYVNDSEFRTVLSLDGTNDVVDFGEIAAFKRVNDLSMSIWIKTTSTLHEYAMSNHTEWFSTPSGSYIATGSGNVFISKNTSGGNVGATSTFPINDGKWHHIVGVISSTEGLKLYIDGVLNQTNANTDNVLYEAGTKFSIGNLWNGGAWDIRWFTGNASRGRFYGKALSTQEVENINNYEKNFRHVEIDHGMLGYYPLSKNALDNSYTNKDCVNNGGVTFDGQSASFNGSNQYLGTAIANSDQVLSLSIWVYHINDGTHQTFMGQGSSVAVPIDRFYFKASHPTGNVPHFSYTFDDGTTDVVSDPTLTPRINEWYHVVATIGPTSVSMYINGQLSETKAISKTIAAANTEITIGAGFYNNSVVDHFKGNLAHARIYSNIELTLTQTSAIYNAEKGDFGL